MLDKNDECRGCADCVCADQPRNRMSNDQETQNHEEILHVGDLGCENHIPEMNFTGFGKAYVPQQKLCRIYQATTGFKKGTIFPELNIPYEGRWRNER
ncbi:MAG: spore coat associated protein CotJA [Defluviitaleaceae bacterium]|nr:spore coat associated protein CotJA [Defluviitaleaceae bacterium]